MCKCECHPDMVCKCDVLCTVAVSVTIPRGGGGTPQQGSADVGEGSSLNTYIFLGFGTKCTSTVYLNKIPLDTCSQGTMFAEYEL